MIKRKKRIRDEKKILKVSKSFQDFKDMRRKFRGSEGQSLIRIRQTWARFQHRIKEFILIKIWGGEKRTDHSSEIRSQNFPMELHWRVIGLLDAYRSNEPDAKLSQEQQIWHQRGKKTWDCMSKSFKIKLVRKGGQRNSNYISIRRNNDWKGRLTVKFINRKK